MTPYAIRFTKEAVKDVDKLPPRLKEKFKVILRQQVTPNPRCGKRLVGDLAGFLVTRCPPMSKTGVGKFANTPGAWVANRIQRPDRTPRTLP